jgi:hypothetical protein
MLRLGSVLLGLLFLAFAPAALLAQDKLVIFGGYSYLRPPVTVEEAFVCTAVLCPPQPVGPPVFLTSRQNLNGWELSATYRFLPFLGIAADVSGHYGSAFSGFSSSTHQQTYLVGPEVSLPSRVSPFAHVLVGGTHQSISAGSGSVIAIGVGQFAIVPATNSAFATALGVGIDLKLVPHIWIRPIQIDYLVTRLSGNTQNQARVSAGVALHF